MMRKISLVAIAFFIGCAAIRADAPPAEKLPVVPLQIDNATLSAEIAVTHPQQERGLMFRRHLDDNSGMLFVFDRERQVGFWMKNTYIPLSIAFVDRDGRILQIEDMEPLNERLIQSRSKEVAYAVEVNQKWFALNQVKEGDRIIPVGRTWKELAAASGKTN